MGVKTERVGLETAEMDRQERRIVNMIRSGTTMPQFRDMGLGEIKVRKIAAKHGLSVHVAWKRLDARRAP